MEEDTVYLWNKIKNEIAEGRKHYNFMKIHYTKRKRSAQDNQPST